MRNDIIVKLRECINKIKLSREEEDKELVPRYKKEYFGEYNTFYYDSWKETLKNLIEIRQKYNTNREFYVAISQMFAETYIPLLIKEFNITDESLIDNLIKITNGTNIIIFDNDNQAAEFVNSYNENLGGDAGAFKFREYICFTPESEIIGEVSKEKSVELGAKMLASMIHETIHFLISISKDEYFNYKEESIPTNAGKILEEGVVEFLSLFFSKKYGLVHMPAMHYMNNVDMCMLLMQYYGEDEFYKQIFNFKYDEIIPSELLEEYKKNERIRFFSKKGYNVDESCISLDINKKII